MQVALGITTVAPLESDAVIVNVIKVEIHKAFDLDSLVIMLTTVQSQFHTSTCVSNLQHNDIAILTLETAVNYSTKISPTCLPNPGFANSLIGEDLVAIGWGSLSQSGDYPSDLRQVTVKGLSNQSCKSVYAPNVITRSTVCVASPGKSSCYVILINCNGPIERY